MQGWINWARAAAGAAAMVGASGVAMSGAWAQDGPLPRATAYGELAALPDWSGVWQADWGTLFGPGGGPAQPKLTPAAQARLDAFRAREEAEGVGQLAQIECIPPGMPAIMRQPYPMEIIFSPGRVTIFAETYSQARRIYTDGRPLPEDPDLLFNGNSVGRWEGDTLVVDTIGFSPQTNIMAGIPHSGDTRIQERIWLERPGQLLIETTVTNPEIFTEPFVTTQAYALEADWEIREYVCAENNRLVTGEGGANVDLGLDDFDEEDPFGPLPPED